jgi:hypothetical protein
MKKKLEEKDEELARLRREWETDRCALREV